MANQAEILEALTEYMQLSNGNQRLRRMNRDWTKVVQFHALDTNEDYFMKVTAGEIVESGKGMQGSNPDIVISATSETFCDMFWGDLNPTSKYL